MSGPDDGFGGEFVADAGFDPIGPGPSPPTPPDAPRREPIVLEFDPEPYSRRRPGIDFYRATTLADGRWWHLPEVTEGLLWLDPAIRAATLDVHDALRAPGESFRSWLFDLALDRLIPRLLAANYRLAPDEAAGLVAGGPRSFLRDMAWFLVSDKEPLARAMEAGRRCWPSPN